MYMDHKKCSCANGLSDHSVSLLIFRMLVIEYCDRTSVEKDSRRFRKSNTVPKKVFRRFYAVPFKNLT